MRVLFVTKNRTRFFALEAIVSTLTDEVFHKATEGLGVLMQLPAQPQEKDAESLLAILEKIGALMRPVAAQTQKVARS